MNSTSDQSSFTAARSARMSLHTGDHRFSADVARADTIPASYLDASISSNLPPRRSMKMLKDGSDFVWPDAAHALFVKGLQAWKALTYNSKRTRAPRGEGKTDFLVRFLQSHGVERTKKQVASHLQVLRTEWRNLDNPVLLSLVDEAHSRSMSEPSSSLPPIITGPLPSTSSSVFEDSPELNNEVARATPISASPHPHSPLRQTIHSSSPNNPNSPSSSSLTTHASARIHSNSDIPSSWQPTTTHSTWSNNNHLMERHRPNTHNIYPNPPYDSPISPHDYGRSAGSLSTPPHPYANTYYNPQSNPTTSTSSARPTSLSEGGSPLFHMQFGSSSHYHQGFLPNDTTYAYQSRSHNDYGLLNYPHAQQYASDAQIGAQARRPSYPAYEHSEFHDFQGH